MPDIRNQGLTYEFGIMQTFSLQALPKFIKFSNLFLKLYINNDLTWKVKCYHGNKKLNWLLKPDGEEKESSLEQLSIVFKLREQ